MICSTECFILLFYFILFILFLFLFCRRNAAAGQNFRYSSEISPPVANFRPLRLFGCQGPLQLPNCTIKNAPPPHSLSDIPPPLPHASASPLQHDLPISALSARHSSPLPHTQASSHGSDTRRAVIQAQGSDPYPCQRWHRHFQGCRRPLSGSGCRGTSCFTTYFSHDAESSLC